MRSSIEWVRSSISSSFSITCSAAARSPSSSACGATGDRFGGERGETDDVDAQLVERLVERLARSPLGDPRAARWWPRAHSARSARISGTPSADPVDSSLLVYLIAIRGQSACNSAVLRCLATRTGSDGTVRTTLEALSAWPRGRQRQRCGGGTLPPARTPHAGVGSLRSPRRAPGDAGGAARVPVTTRCTCSAMVTAWSPIRS